MKLGWAVCTALFPVMVLATDTGSAPAPAKTYVIRGKIAGKGAIAEVTVTLAGPGAQQQKTTDASGSYSFEGLASGPYALTPALAGHAFAPPTLSVKVDDDDATAPDIVSTPAVAPTSVSGMISGSVANDVTVTRSNGLTSEPCQTEDGGRFECERVSPGTYTIVPSKRDYAFRPASVRVHVRGDAVTGNVFVAGRHAAALHTISGSILGAVVSGVAVDVTGQNDASGLSNGSGGYAIANLVDGTYTVTPSAEGYVFTPGSASVTLNGGNVTGISFRATATRCVPPVVTFRWIGVRGAFMTTNARFAPIEPSTLGRVARERSTDVLPSIRILSKDDHVLAEFKDLAYFKRCVNRDPKGCEEQGFQVDFQTQDAKLLDNGGRVQVEFNGLEDCSGRVKLQDVVAIEQHHLSIDTGLAFSLNAAGSFVSHLEAALDANSRWLRWLSGDVDLPKRRAEGHALRLALLATALGPLPNVGEARRRLGRSAVGLDDLVDALACLVAAGRIAAGSARRLPAASGAPRDARGLLMEILF